MSSRIPSIPRVICRALPLVLASFLSALSVAAAPAAHQPLPIVGRWDVTVTGPGYTYPAWFEIREDSSGLSMRFAGRYGPPVDVPYVTWDGRQLEFRFTTAHRWRAAFNGRWFAGTTANEDETWLGLRAPELSATEPHWAEPRPLFDGRTLEGWRPRQPGSDHGWRVRDGSLANDFPGDDLVSVKRFMNFKLSLRFRLQPVSDSGVLLRGRYEVQLTSRDDPGGPTCRTGGIYGQLAPVRAFAAKPGVWHSLDVVLVGREVAVAIDGVTLLDRAIIPGLSADALDSREGASGPLVLQGSVGPVEFRDIVVTPAR